MEQRLLHVIRAGQFGQITDGEIDRAVVEQVVDRLRIGRYDDERGARRQMRDLFDQVGQAGQFTQFAGRDDETAPVVQGIEGFFLQQAAIDQIENFRHGSGERQRARRGFEAALGAHEQRIVEQDAQAIQRLAHRRLADAEMFRRHGAVAIAQQGIDQLQMPYFKILNVHHLPLKVVIQEFGDHGDAGTASVARRTMAISVRKAAKNPAEDRLRRVVESWIEEGTRESAPWTASPHSPSERIPAR